MLWYKRQQLISRQPQQSGSASASSWYETPFGAPRAEASLPLIQADLSIAYLIVLRPNERVNAIKYHAESSFLVRAVGRYGDVLRDCLNLLVREVVLSLSLIHI